MRGVLGVALGALALTSVTARDLLKESGLTEDEKCCGEGHEIVAVCYRTAFHLDCAGKDMYCCPFTSRSEIPTDVGTEGNEGDEGDEGHKLPAADKVEKRPHKRTSPKVVITVKPKPNGKKAQAKRSGKKGQKRRSGKRSQPKRGSRARARGRERRRRFRQARAARRRRAAAARRRKHGRARGHTRGHTERGRKRKHGH